MKLILTIKLTLWFLIPVGDFHEKNYEKLFDGFNDNGNDNDKYLKEYLYRKHRHKHGELFIRDYSINPVNYNNNNNRNAEKFFYKTNVRNLIADDNWPVKSNQGFHWPVKKEAEVDGDLILGGLMMVHEREDSVTCGPIMPQGGIQALETMLYTLDVINNGTLLPDIRLGAHILDDCDKDSYGLEMAVDFIKGIDD
ncbi:conserved hypothetical protein [Pediculus humanus corporis]|uniref:Uncharacterized protein n=1 Tax=Pediculus humanus subsp. corporis TaxID=121224 RepID=E0W0K9_PEDHC|nr:uncharacterized protein Phum_PHUM558320 [Pediculus humanus corporis]EEB19165.1 conserved hypothetical protein [Pediculus humanus corporis]